LDTWIGVSESGERAGVVGQRAWSSTKLPLVCSGPTRGSIWGPKCSCGLLVSLENQGSDDVVDLSLADATQPANERIRTWSTSFIVCCDLHLVRIEEMRQSVRIIVQCPNQMPSGMIFYVVRAPLRE
jgi:hypothetical protein